MATFIEMMNERNRDMNEDSFLSFQSKQGDKPLTHKRLPREKETEKRKPIKITAFSRCWLTCHFLLYWSDFTGKQEHRRKFSRWDALEKKLLIQLTVTLCSSNSKLMNNKWMSKDRHAKKYFDPIIGILHDI